MSLVAAAELAPIATTEPADAEGCDVERGRGVVHVAALVLFFQSYSLVRAWVAGTPTPSFAHARTVMRIERWLHLPAEQRLQAAIADHPGWSRAASAYYGSVHFVVPVVVLLCLYRRGRDRYGLAVRVFVIVNVIAVVSFAVWPLMPPRLLPGGYGFVDLGARFPGIPVDRALANGPGNGFAAMPSLHAAYAVWSVWAAWPLLRARARVVAPAYPLLTALVVVVTGNHYWLDVAAGVALSGVSVCIVSAVSALPAHRHAIRGDGMRSACLVGLALIAAYWLKVGEPLNAAVSGGFVLAVLGVTPRRGIPSSGSGHFSEHSARAVIPEG